jgi:arabinofuranan 3-O-arabinosyltransferase
MSANSAEDRSAGATPGMASGITASRSWQAGHGPEKSPRLLAMLAPQRLWVTGYGLAACYAVLLFLLYKFGYWLVDRAGRPFLNDFTYFWIGGQQVLRGGVASLYDPAQFKSLETALVGPNQAKLYFNPHWPYPPTFFLVLAPLATLPYSTSFVVWEVVTLLGCTVVVYLVVRRWLAIILTLASPFSFANIFTGQTGFLAVFFVGAALLALRRRPLVAGFFIGCLTYKPQYGILFPVALVAARKWRALGSAAITAIVLAATSAAAFGAGSWLALPHALLDQGKEILYRYNPGAPLWIAVDSVYGLVLACHGSAWCAWLVQGCTAAGAAAIVWFVWRSQTRHALKAALLVPATLIATPYEWLHDLTLLLVPMAFLVTDQIDFGLLRGADRNGRHLRPGLRDGLWPDQTSAKSADNDCPDRRRFAPIATRWRPCPVAATSGHG